AQAPPRGEQGQRFEDVGLAGPVLADQQVDRRASRQAGAGVIAEAYQGDAIESHALRPDEGMAARTATRTVIRCISALFTNMRRTDFLSARRRFSELFKNTTNQRTGTPLAQSPAS